MFSEKYGYKAEKQIQHKSVSDILRARIWNLFYQWEVLDGGLTSPRLSQAMQGKQSVEAKIADRLGFIVNGSMRGLNLQGQLERYVTQTCSWYELYDFVDIHLEVIDEGKRAQRAQQYNALFEQEKAGYRIVNCAVEPITNQQEIDIIESASNSPYRSVNEHLQKALEFYGDRRNPDYENSIKESISAVEAMCCIITGKDATLNKAIEKLKCKGVHIHPCLEKAFVSLYAYTCDEKGIRHAGIDFVDAPAEDAKYMLVSCSAFVNYLIEKWSKIGDLEV